MRMGGIIFILLGWNIIGAILLFGSAGTSNGVLGHSYGWEFVNPYWVHEWNHVNWFGAILVATIYALMCPFGAVCYWIYWICTVGRK